jgi:hypothetical protein
VDTVSNGEVGNIEEDFTRNLGRKTLHLDFVEQVLEDASIVPHSDRNTFAVDWNFDHNSLREGDSVEVHVEHLTRQRIVLNFFDNRRVSITTYTESDDGVSTVFVHNGCEIPLIDGAC